MSLNSKKGPSKLIKAGISNLITKSSEIMRPNSFCDDKTDLILIHNYILYRLRNLKSSIKDLEEKKKFFTDSIERGLRNSIEYRSYQDEVNKINSAIETIKQDQPVKEYLEESYEILDEWKKYVKESPICLSSISIDPDRLFLVKRYVAIAERYVADIKFEVIRPKRGDLCHYCWNRMEMLNEDLLYCAPCDNYRYLDVCDYATESIAEERIHVNNNYANRITYEKYLTHYEGLQDPGWDKKDNPKWNFEIIKKYFLEYANNNGYDIDDITPLDTICIFDNLTKITKLPFNKHYVDAILFTHLINGWELPSLGNHREELLKDHEEFYTVYPLFKGSRESAMNCQFIHMKFMQRRKIPFRIENIKLAETGKILAENDRVASACFQERERLRIEEGRTNEIPWKYYPTV